MEALSSSLSALLAIPHNQGRQIAAGLVDFGNSLGHTFESALNFHYLSHKEALGLEAIYLGLIQRAKATAEPYEPPSLSTFMGSTEVDTYLVKRTGEQFIIEMTLGKVDEVIARKPAQIAKFLQKFPSTTVMLIAPNASHSALISNAIAHQISYSLRMGATPHPTSKEADRLKRFKVYAGPQALSEHMKDLTQSNNHHGLYVNQSNIDQ